MNSCGKYSNASSPASSPGLRPHHHGDLSAAADSVTLLSAFIHSSESDNGVRSAPSSHLIVPQQLPMDDRLAPLMPGELAPTPLGASPLDKIQPPFGAAVPDSPEYGDDRWARDEREEHVGRRSRGGTNRDGDEEDGEGEETDSVPADERTSCLGLRRAAKRLDPLFMTVFKWTLGGLLVLFLTFVVFGILYSGIAYKGDVRCGGTGFGASRCDSAFGSIVGGHDGVFAFSNCNTDTYSHEDSFTPVYTVPHLGGGSGAVMPAELYSGLRWQCVEYARRYWIMRGAPEPAFFGSVDGAADIWAEANVSAVIDQSRQLPLRRFPNGRTVMAGGAAPQVGDIIIYGRDNGEEFPHGHVAVIVGKDLWKVFVAEQNWARSQWTSPFRNYSRTIPLRYDAGTFAYTLEDTSGVILGWMRYG